MKKLTLFLLVVIVIIVGGTFGYEKLHPKNDQVMVPPTELTTPTPTTDESSSPLASVMPTKTPQPTTTTESVCAPTDILATIALEAGAGNIYGTLSLQNKSKHSCSINGNDYVIPQYEAKNITVSRQGTVGEKSILLSAGQTVYSQVHFPNGPQCQGPTVEGTVSFTYPISDSQSVVFSDDSGEVRQPIQLCSSATDNTEVQVWSISNKPVNQ